MEANHIYIYIQVQISSSKNSSTKMEFFSYDQSDLVSQFILDDHHSMFWFDHETEINADLSSCFVSEDNSSSYDDNYFKSFFSAEDHQQVFQDVHNQQLQERTFTDDFGVSGSKRKFHISDNEVAIHAEIPEKKPRATTKVLNMLENVVFVGAKANLYV